MVEESIIYNGMGEIKGSLYKKYTLIVFKTDQGLK